VIYGYSESDYGDDEALELLKGLQDIVLRVQR